jgi:hypothetical protein
MRRIVLLVTATGALGALSACGPVEPGATNSTSAGEPTLSTAVVPPATAVGPTSTVATQAPTSASFLSFAMPNLVGLDLQTAQNMVQTHRIFYSKSHDLLGSRHQIVDSDWIVCSQNIPAGQQVTSDIEGQIDFGVVKRTETCP